MAKNILITTSTYPRWEGDKIPDFVAEFATRLKDKGFSINVVAPHFKAAKKKEHIGRVNVVRFRYFWPAKGEDLVYEGGGVAKVKKSPLYVIKLTLFLLSLFFNTIYQSSKTRSDIINAHWIIPQGFAAVIAGLIIRKRVVVTVHGSDVFSLNGKLLKKIKAFTLKHADTVVVNSTATLSACKNLCDRDDYKVIPMGSDMEAFKPTAPSNDLITKYDLNKFTILFVGRLNEVKGTIYLLKALKMLKVHNAEFKALIIGDGPEKSSLMDYVKDNELSENVMFIGWVESSDLNKFYSIADIFVGPSITSSSGEQEGLGMVFIEALASGVPVIATRAGGIVDIVQENKNGKFVEAKSPESIYESLVELYQKPALLSGLAKQARPSVIEKYSWENVIDKYSKVFD